MNRSTIRAITVNQIGYPLDSNKQAIFTMEGTFHVVEESSGEIVFTGQTSPLKNDEPSGHIVAFGDFSNVNDAGRYHIHHEMENVISATFTIHERPYTELHHGLLKAFYYFRCGQDLAPEFAGPWHHNACHLTKGFVYDNPEQLLDCSGGWHDAGDYGKYVVPGAKAVADLLLAYELYPSAFNRPTPIPETDGIVPDVLHECRWELDWMLNMQDPSGGVFHKLTTHQFPPLTTLPEDDLDPLLFSPISSTATGCFAAVMAKAARIYQPFDTDFAQKCEQAAIHAWHWLVNHPDVVAFHNPPDIGTGDYSDLQDIDDRYWAACELYATTHDPIYHHALLTISKEPFHKFGLCWSNIGGYGSLTYLLSDSMQKAPELYDQLLNGLRNEADYMLWKSTTDGYGISLLKDEYIWGSNKVVMNNAMLLLIAYRFFKDSRYEAAALNHVHYLLGRNSLDISFVTGFGDHSVQHPHYRPSIADDIKDPVPGLVCGGPNAGLHDDISKDLLQGLPPAQCFIDHEDSYATNEVAVYWNSPALFVLSHWEQQQ
ncbi:glycoside hydrolase family 9 protein [Paenibacillus sp. SC116]|uniref:glycoside hydrolase family 9 protein n=1 Tax=Paenibacillus sp. SC116 TaxID=2968986 RepID=UPI00215A8160|nr:glycoside hydrolase family 9 protein [Paenibacillus sp. SC116]MCR8843250.1 glycoside hydrolase family 9 protein [Paenibacillus sp. SC116]